MKTRIQFLLLAALLAFLPVAATADVCESNNDPAFVKRVIMRSTIVCGSGYYQTTFTCEHNLVAGDSMTFVNAQYSDCYYTYSVESCTLIPVQPLTFPSGTDTRNFTMPAYYENGQLMPKSVITVGVMPDLTTAAIINGNKWISAPAWLDGYMKNPNWMLDNDPNEDAPARLVFGFLQVGPAIPHIIRGVTVIVTEQTAVDAAAATAVLTGEEAALLVATYMASWAIEVLRLRLPDGVFSYVSYEKIQPVNHKVYAGRTAGRGVPLVVLARRDAAHALVRPDYNGAILHSSTTWSGLSFRGYAGMRGREQQVIDFHRDRAQSTDVFEFSGNAINGVSPSNSEALTYWLTSDADFGELSTYRAYASVGAVPANLPVRIGPPFSRPPLTNP